MVVHKDPPQFFAKKQNGHQNTTLIVTQSNLNNINLNSYRLIVIISQLKNKQIKQNEYAKIISLALPQHIAYDRTL